MRVKVAFFADILLENFDGCVRTIHQLIKRFPKDKFEVIFFCGMKPSEDLGFEYFEIPTLKLPINSTYKMALPFFVQTKIEYKLSKFRPNVIHVSNPSPLGAFATKYGIENNIPLVSIYHTHFLAYVNYYAKMFPFLIPPLKKYVINYTRKIYDNCQIFYVPTTTILESFEVNGYLTSNCKIWKRGIDLEMFSPSKKSGNIYKTLTNNDKPNVFFASRLVWEKNLKTLIGIYKQIEIENLNLNFIIAGEGVASLALKKEMRNAYFVGNLSHKDLAVYYASSDVFIFPSDTETFGNVVVEAMASGLPCIAANGGGPKSIITNGKNGFLIEPNDVAGFVEKIKLVISDCKLRNSIIKNGIDYTANLDWDELANAYFEDLINLNNSKKLKLAGIE